MPTVSVVVPSYNCEAFIEETIDSVLNQTFKDIELLVVDDGSTDRTTELVASYGYPVRLISQANARVCAARNRGIHEAKGEFICLLDHDDYWFPSKLERQLEVFAEAPEAGVVYSTFMVWDPEADGTYPDPTGFDLSQFPDDIDPAFSGWIYHQFLLDCWMLTSTTMFRAEVFRRCGVFDESLPFTEDWELWLRTSREFPMVQLSRPTTLYRQHPEQGNRLVRDVDYRTQLLIKSKQAWGLCSRDGRCVTPRQFRQQIAKYHAAYALHHLRAGNKSVAFNSLRKAWLADPVGFRYPVYILAGVLGWQPS